jgi:uncharacterized protein YciI
MLSHRHERACGRGYIGLMYVVVLRYTKPVEEANLVLPDHSEWVSQHYRTGDFVAEGYCSDTGRIIIACAMPRGRLDAILATDPLTLQHLARPEVIEFQAFRTIPELAQYADRLVA